MAIHEAKKKLIILFLSMICTPNFSAEKSGKNNASYAQIIMVLSLY